MSLDSIEDGVAFLFLAFIFWVIFKKEKGMKEALQASTVTVGFIDEWPTGPHLEGPLHLV